MVPLEHKVYKEYREYKVRSVHLALKDHKV